MFQLRFRFDSDCDCGVDGCSSVDASAASSAAFGASFLSRRDYGGARVSRVLAFGKRWKRRRLLNLGNREVSVVDLCYILSFFDVPIGFSFLFFFFQFFSNLNLKFRYVVDMKGNCKMINKKENRKERFIVFGGIEDYCYTIFVFVI